MHAPARAARPAMRRLLADGQNSGSHGGGATSSGYTSLRLTFKTARRERELCDHICCGRCACSNHTLSCWTVEPLTTALQTAPSLVGSQLRSRGLIVACKRGKVAVHFQRHVEDPTQGCQRWHCRLLAGSQRGHIWLCVR